MPDYQYLIIGGGMTADAAVKGIRQIDTNATIGIISDESSPPYKRPPLSKALWKGDPVDTVWLASALEGAEIHLRHHARSIDRKRRRVTDDEGVSYRYTKLLLATGGIVRKLPWHSAVLNNSDLVLDCVFSSCFGGVHPPGCD